MPHPIEASTLRILKPTGETVGTGFLVSKNLAVTCAHVVKILDAGAGDTIDIRFTGKSASTAAHVLPEYWRPDALTDIAILHVDDVPTGVFPLRMGRASESRLKNDLYTFGYAIAADEQGIGGLGTFITLKQDGNFIQFRMHEANHGHSGAPIYDDQRGVVVGMVKKGHTSSGRNAETTFAIPTETLWQVCPQLKPPTPALPRRNPIVEGINLLPYDYDQRIQNFLTEYIGTESHPVPFGGRDEALRMLDNWLADTTPYLLLAAPAGRGKSALLVRWLDSLSAHEDLALAFVPVSIRFGTNMERIFYAALAARLAFLHGDDVPASPETSTAVYRGLVADYLSKSLANGRTLLVVLDGLDEAADWRIKADFMPAELPAGVRVVVSARFLAGDADSKTWLSRLNWERKGLASAPSLIPLSQDGVRDVLFKMGCPLDELSRQVDIVAELYRLSEGDPLLVGLYVGDLWAKGEEVTRLKPEDLVGIQPGYKGYFDRWWDDQKELWGRQKPWLERHVRAVRCLLAGALGPLFRDDLQALDPELESDYIADALDILKRFIIGDNQTQGYTFNHPKLGQYFWESLTEIEQVQWEKRFLDWGERTLQEFIDGKRNPDKKKEVPFYVVTNYSVHLKRAEQAIEKWLPLIHNQQWAKAWFTVEGAYGGYSQDVQRVWGQCRLLDRQAIGMIGKAPYLSKQIRCALIEASLHSLAGNIPIELIPVLVKVGLWTLPQTWVFINQITRSDQQSKAISEIIPYLDERQRLEVFDKAILMQNETDQAQIFGVLAQWLPQEYLARVLDAGKRIKGKENYAELLAKLAHRLPEILDEAVGAARDIQDDTHRACLLADLSQYRPELADEALKAARAILPEYRSHALSVLAQFIPEDRLDQVLFETIPLDDGENEDDVLISLAQRQPKLMDNALKSTQRVSNESHRSLLLTKLVPYLPEEVLMQVQDMALKMDGENCIRVLIAFTHRSPQIAKKTLELTRGVKDKRSRANLLCALAQSLPEITSEALDTAWTIQDDESHAIILSAMVEYLPEKIDEVLVAALAIQNEYKRVKVLSELVQHIPSIAGEVLKGVGAIQDEGYRTKALSELAQHLPEEALGQILELVSAIQNEWKRSEVLNVLTQRLPERLLGQVLEDARAMQYETPRASVLCELALRLPSVAGEALKRARAIGDQEYSASVLTTFAHRIPGVAVEVLAIARAMQNEDKRASVLCKLAQRMPSMAGEVLKASRAIQDEGDRTQVLRELAQHLPEEELGQVLEAMRGIRADWRRIDILMVLAQRIPERMLEQVLEDERTMYEGYHSNVLSKLAQRLPEEKLEQVLERAQAMNAESSRARVLSALAQRMPNLAVEALKIARTIQDEGYRTSMFIELSQPLMQVPIRASYDEMELSLSALSNRTRASLFSDLAALMPVLIHLGTEDTPREIYSAVRDVTTWWP